MKNIKKIIREFQVLLKDFYDYKVIEKINKSVESEILKISKNISPKTSDEEYIVSDKIRTYSSIIISYGEKYLASEKLIDLLFTFGKKITALGELNIAMDIFKHLVLITERIKRYKCINAYASLSIGEIYSRQALWKESFTWINKSKSKFLKIHDLRGLATCENLLGTIYGETGKISKSELYFKNALSHLDEKNDKVIIAGILANLGIINNIRNNFDAAFSYFKRSLLNFEEIGDLRRIAEIRHNLGMYFLQKNKFNLALKEFEKSIRISNSHKYLPTLAISFQSVAFIYSQLRDFELATAYADRGFDISNRINDKLTIADIYKVKGIIKREQKSYLEAENYFLSSLRINKDFNNELNFAETSFELGILYKQMDNTGPSKIQFNNSLNFYKKYGSKEQVERICQYLN